jgi:predicted metal-dependent peptidase
MGLAKLQGAYRMNQPAEDLTKWFKEIDRAKLVLMDQKETTFYSCFLSHMNIRISRAVPTAGTDGLQIIFNPDFLASITRPQLLGLMLHEVEHVVNDHCNPLYEKADLCPDVLNVAQDHYINLRLKARGYELPPTPKLGGPPNTHGYADPQYAGMSSMEIYDKLPKNGGGGNQGNCLIPGSGQGNLIIDPDLMDVLPCPENLSPEELQEKVMQNIIKAVITAETAKDAGSIPGHLQQNLDDVLSPRLPWNTILQQYLTAYSPDDYSMRRPNRRFMPDWYLPTLYGEKLGHLLMYCDVSGSMSKQMISEIHSEFTYIIDTMKPSSVHIMTGDTQITRDVTYEQGEYVPAFEYSGGGGTHFGPVIDRIREQQPVFALLFTDGYFCMPNLDGINGELFWIIKGNPSFKAPKGVVIHFN